MGNCRFDRKALRKGYEHAAIQDYTRRWNKVLRHDIRHSGKSAGCDGLGWVSVEEFLRNDHAWPLDEPKAYNYSARSYNEDVIHERRRTLMQGYCMVYIELQAHQKKTHDCAQYVLPSDMPEIHRFEKPEIYVAERLSRSSGLARPVAIRSTAGHSFSGERKGPIMCQHWSGENEHQVRKRDGIQVGRWLPCDQSTECDVNCGKRYHARGGIRWARPRILWRIFMLRGTDMP